MIYPFTGKLFIHYLRILFETWSIINRSRSKTYFFKIIILSSWKRKEENIRMEINITLFFDISNEKIKTHELYKTDNPNIFLLNHLIIKYLLNVLILIFPIKNFIKYYY